VSHRTHNGRQIDQHTEREFAEPAIWALVALGALCIAIALLGGCASTSVTCTDLATGACTVTSSRLLTDSGVNLTTPDGLALGFSSKPNEAGVSAAFTQLGSVIGLLGKLVAAQAPAPAPPAPPPVVVPVPPPLPPFHPASLPMLEAPDL
jgi:hypothetical protein